MPTILSTDPLTIYLNDHLAGATFGCNLARRAAKNNASDSLFGPTLARIADDIEADRRSLLAIAAELRVPRDRVKVALAWAAEIASRAKPSGHPFRYTPLCLLLELEGLASGIEGKAALWSALRSMTALRVDLDGRELDRLLERASHQQREVKRLHAEAARRIIAT
jgi:hypothetical protein